MIPYGRQSIDQSDIDAVLNVLQSDFLTQGPSIPNFEHTVTQYLNAKYGVALNSATSALHVACLALGVGPGDTVWTSPNTFVASANCARYCGADVDFVDINPKTYNLCADSLETKLRQAATRKMLPKVVIPVHFAGQSCEMESIWELSQKYGFRIIEDASHAIGGFFQNQKIGNCRFSDATVLSFHPVKIITTGEGGMLVTNSPDIHEKSIRLRTHGITRDDNLMTQPSHGPWYYEQLELGLNYRMTDIQAALGCSQIRRIDDFVERRSSLANKYNSLLNNLPVTLPWQHPDTKSSWHLYVIQPHTGEAIPNRRTIFESLRHVGIGVNVHYIPVHLQPYYQRIGFRNGDFPNAEAYYNRAISLPLFPGLSEENQLLIVNALHKLINR